LRCFGEVTLEAKGAAGAFLPLNSTWKENRLKARAGGMNPLRGLLMLVAAGIAFYRGWKIHTGEYALMAYGLGVLALGMAVWHLTRSVPRRGA
jgi:hypothetical protein